MKLKELKNLRESIKKFDVADFALNYQLFELLQNLDTELKPLDDMDELIDSKIKEFNTKVVKLNEKYCVRDEQGQVKVKNNKYAYAEKDIPKRQAEYDALVTKYGRYLNAGAKTDTEYQSVIEQESKLKLPVIEADFKTWRTDDLIGLSKLLPAEITTSQLPDSIKAHELYELSKVVQITKD